MLAFRLRRLHWEGLYLGQSWTHQVAILEQDADELGTSARALQLAYARNAALLRQSEMGGQGVHRLRALGGPEHSQRCYSLILVGASSPADESGALLSLDANIRDAFLVPETLGLARRCAPRAPRWDLLALDQGWLSGGFSPAFLDFALP